MLMAGLRFGSPSHSQQRFPGLKDPLGHADVLLQTMRDGRVSFVPFLGISPYRYRDIFQKAVKRKRGDGTAKRWIADFETPMVESTSNSYIEIELDEMARIFGRFTKDDPTDPITK
jgi:hypothetical protein